MPSKFIKDAQGKLKINPEWQAEQSKSSIPPKPLPEAAITTVSSMEDVMAAQELGFQLEKSTDEVITQSLEAEGPIDEFSQLLQQWELPIGYVHHMNLLSKGFLAKIIDDSYSMIGPTDVYVRDAISYLRPNITRQAAETKAA